MFKNYTQKIKNKSKDKLKKRPGTLASSIKICTKSTTKDTNISTQPTPLTTLLQQNKKRNVLHKSSLYLQLQAIKTINAKM